MGTSSQGMKLEVESETPGTYTEIPEVASIRRGGSVGKIDTTHLSSTAKESTPSLPDEGEVSCDGNFLPDDTVHRQLLADKVAGTKRNYRIVYPASAGGGNDKFQGYVGSFDINGNTDSKLAWSFTINVDGAVEYTAGT